jgi:hypothetical protein
MVPFECPACHRVSHHPQDAAQLYCGACHRFFPRPQISSMIDMSRPQVVFFAVNEDGKFRLRLVAHHPQHGDETLICRTLFDSQEEALSSEEAKGAIEAAKRAFGFDHVELIDKRKSN